MTAHLCFVHALSPVHCGTGQSISGIDLPIARERSTGIPLIPGSSIKGVLRASPGGWSSADSPKQIHLAAFGPDTKEASDYAGAVQLSDANLVFLPMRSVRGTFAWVTSPYMLRRLARDVAETGQSWKVPLPAIAKDDGCVVSKERLIVKAGGRERVVLEDFDFEPTKSGELDGFAHQIGAAIFGAGAKADIEHFAERVCVVGDDVMHVLLRVGMEVTARNRISNETKTVEKGALWTEEALPVESILVGAIVVTPVVRKKAGEPLEQFAAPALIEHVRSLCKGAVQLGGKATVGRGVCKLGVL